MGTKIHCESYLPLYYSMRDLNDDSSSSSWPLFDGEKAVTNGQHCKSFIPRPTMDGYPRYDKDALKQKILKHEAVFKNQVCELHRLYRIQRDMMEEARRKEPSCGLQDQESAEPSSSSSRRGSRLPPQDAQNWRMAGFPLINENGAAGALQFLNGPVSKESEAFESRPLKVRKKLVDLQLPAHEYVDTEDVEKSPEVKVADVPSDAMNSSLRGGLDCRNKLHVDDRGGLDTDSRVAASASSGFRKSTGLADLNEPVEIEDDIAPSSVDFIGQNTSGEDSKVTKQNMPNGVHCAESNRVLDINLNEVVSKEAVEKRPVHISAIPWLTSSRKSVVVGNSSCRLDSSPERGWESGTVGDLNQPFVPNTLSISSDCGIMSRPVGVPISETGKLKNQMIDINLEYEPDGEKFEEETKPTPIRDYIDLNCCARDDEDTATPSSDGKRAMEIDLEASVLPVDDDVSFRKNTTEDEAAEVSNSLENKSESLQDEALTNAAELMVTISSFHPRIHEEDEHVFNEPEASLANAFLSFVDALSSRANELMFTVKTDEFEAATLRLPEMKGEDCMPKPVIPDEAGANAVGPGVAARRLQSRRGRQRRDFQRDILPGMVSLSRQEVTEDLQIFSGLMRATGHHWNSGLTRRNGGRSRGGRSHGRCRSAAELVVQTAAACAPPVSKIGASLVDRSLMGWGKTTRRPRRQRCQAAAAATAAVLT